VAEDRVPARQAAVISAVACLVTLLGLLDDRGPTAGAVLGVALLHAVHALVLATTRPRAGGLLAAGLVMFALLGGTAWVLDGYASGIGPLYVLVFAWFGLHCPRRYLYVAVPWSAATYAGGLVLADAAWRLVGSTGVLIPIATVVSLLISHRVYAARTLREEIERRERWRAALTATLAHDVRSPLSTVIGTLEILEDDAALDGYRPLLAAATRQTRRVLSLATGLLEVERVEHGSLVLDRADVHLAEIAANVAALTRPEAVRVDIAPDLVVHGDAERLEQVLFNLANNALRHGRPPVVIGAATVPGCVEVSVEDHGGGVPDPDVPFLFDRFSTADRSPQSVGLGLWIVHTLVEAHGGEVRYEAPRGGARFVFTLPA
jgi:signal transduction histidine kinase